MSVAKIRFRIDFGPGEAVGPGKVDLLEQIGESGSISAAARNLGMSYRRAWQLLESLNASFRQPVATTSKGGKGGGGAIVTALGHELIRAYRTFEADLGGRAGRHFTALAHKARKRLSRRNAAPIVRLQTRR
jgi:molybdate transport system regulatory protein